MPCLACGRPRGPICPACHAGLRRAAHRSLGDAVTGLAAWSHGGTGRRLVHRLKYDGLVAVAEMAAELAPDPPPAMRCLVPVPRVLSRRLSHGIDPAAVYAAALGRRWGIPVVAALVAPIWAPRRAGRRSRPGPPAFRRSRAAPGAVLVDDVITSGATVLAAADVVDACHAVAVTMSKSSFGSPPLLTMDARDH